MTHWAILGQHVDLAVRAWNLEQYRHLFGNHLGEDIFVFNLEQAQILFATEKQIIPAGDPHPSQQQGVLANLLQQGGRELDQGNNQGERNEQQNFQHNYKQMLLRRVQSMQWDSVSYWHGWETWMMRNLIQAENEDTSTQVHGDIDENFGVPQAEAHNMLR